MSAVIWHNPRCSKSRQTLALLEERGDSLSVRLYLDDPPSADEIRAVIDGGVDLKSLIRRKEAREEGISDVTGDELFTALAAHPRAIERPVVIVGDRAALGRPPESVLALFE